jgi:hypothetical protein
LVEQGNLDVALKRAEAYQSIPNWGRLLFLYLAGEAARGAAVDTVRAAIRAAWNSPISKGLYFPQNNLANALFAHVALLLSKRPGSKLDVEGWMCELDPHRPYWDLDNCLKLIQRNPR